MFHTLFFAKIKDYLKNPKILFLKFMYEEKASSCFFILSISCYILFFLIGSEIDDNGYLNEPFGLLPIGALFFFLSVMIFAWNKLKS